MRSCSRSFVFTTAVLLFFVSARADDFMPPDYRGQNRSVFATWEFDYPPDQFPNGPPDPMPADMFQAVGPAPPPMTLHPQPPVGKIFNFNNMRYDAVAGGWIAGPEDGFIDFNLPNWIDLEPTKYVRVQMTFLDPSGMMPPSVDLIEAFDLAEFPGTSYQGFFSSGGVFDANHVYEDWRIEPNPDWEIIKVLVPSMVTLTEVVIDTVSVPEPVATPWLLCILPAWWAFRRRRP